MSATTPRSSWIAAGLLSAVAFALYAYTAAPGPTLVDSAELALAAATGGIAHPPGFPLFLIVGRVFAALPFADAARMLNLMSAFFMAATAGMVALSVERMLVLAEAARNSPRKPPKDSDDRDPTAWRRVLAGRVAGAAFATAWNPWVWSGVTEVYALNVFLLAAAWWCAWGGVVAWTMGEGPAWRWITGASVLAAAGLANHHATAALAFPVLLAMLAWVRPALFRERRFWITSVASVAGAAALYLQLFVAARHDRVLGWGRVDSFELLVRHVTGQQYQLQVGSSWDAALEVGRTFFGTLITGVGFLPGALLALALIAGARSAWGPATGSRPPRERRRAGRLVLLAPLLMIVLNATLSMAYVAGPEDRMAYDLPATVAWCLLVGVGAWVALNRFRGSVPATAGAALLVIATVGLNVRHHFASVNLHEERAAELLVRETLRDVGPGGVVLTAEWNLMAPYLYLRHLEDVRPDVFMIDVLMMRRFWYMDHLERTMPDLIAQSRAPFDAFRDAVYRFDFGEPYDGTTIQAKYEALLFRWIEIGDAAGGAFADVSCFEHPQEVAWLSKLPTMPRGLLLQLVPGGETRENVGLAPYDAANLRYLRSRLTDGAVMGDLTDLPGRHHPYYRVWRVYQASVEASLLVAASISEEAFTTRAAAYREWFPEIDRVVARVLSVPR